MKIYDCFIFFNELDLLELRLNILNNSVDYFVLVESAITFQGEDKEFYFENNKDRFAKFEHKIIHFIVEKYEFDFAKLPYIQNPKNVDEIVLNKIFKFIDECPRFDKKKQFWWGNDFFQRECIWRALAAANPGTDDLIVISDVDEIPNPQTLLAYKDRVLSRSILAFRQHEFCYYLNYYHNSDWIGTCCFLYGSFVNVSLNAIRFSTKRDEGFVPQIIGNGGWHFTSIGDVDAIKNKIKSWGHKELNTAETLSSIEYNVRYGYDIFRRPGFGKIIDLPISNEMLPNSLVNYIVKFKHLIGPKIEPEPRFQWLYNIVFHFIRVKLFGLFRRLKAI